jgi:hypothetical protein
MLYDVSGLDSVREHARILLEGLRAVLNESTAIGTFLLIPLTVQTFARNGYGRGRGLQRGRAILLSRTRLRAATQPDLSFQPAREAWGHPSQSTEVPSKVTLVGKTGGQRDLGQWQLSVTKQMFNMFEASLQQIAVRWRSN